MSQVEIKRWKGEIAQVVSKSQNLRGILRYASKHGVTRCTITTLGEGRGGLWLEFGDGAWAVTDFGSIDVLHDWVRARRSWGMQLEGDAEGTWHWGIKSLAYKGVK